MSTAVPASPCPPPSPTAVILVLLCWASRELWLQGYWPFKRGAFRRLRTVLLVRSGSAKRVPAAVKARTISRGEDHVRLFESDDRHLRIFRQLSAKTPLRAPERSSPQSRAHALAERYHEAVDFLNVGIAALQLEVGSELQEILRSPWPGRQNLLPRYKHIDVAVD